MTQVISGFFTSPPPPSYFVLFVYLVALEILLIRERDNTTLEKGRYSPDTESLNLVKVTWTFKATKITSFIETLFILYFSCRRKGISPPLTPRDEYAQKTFLL